MGRPTTEKLHVTERFPDYGHPTMDVTIDDPAAYTKPWGNRQEMYLRPAWEPMTRRPLGRCSHLREFDDCR
jgi:hypothetical protein